MKTPRRLTYLRAAKVLLLLFTVTAWADPAGNAKAAGPLTVRWAEGKPGSTFTRGQDGKYRYGLWSGDDGVTLAVDSRELQRARHRLHPFIALLITFHSKAPNGLEVTSRNIRLEFVTHFNVVQSNVDPEDFSVQYQDDVDALVEENEHQIQKHPEKKKEIEDLLQAYQLELLEIQEFLCAHSLRHAKLDRQTPEAKGWVLFNTKNKWIGDWKKREDFVLRVPVRNQIFEFPFTVPPVEGDLILRRRPENSEK
jgi:hypothetical protein